MELMLLIAKIFAEVSLVCLSIALTTFWIRKLIDLVLVGVFLGSIGLAGIEVYKGAVAAWGEIVAMSIVLGIGAGLICTVLMPLSSKGIEKSKTISDPPSKPQTQAGLDA
ncbi:hypothetical protein K9N68_18175 [Kovacikia minuta CCNUW1]|uniref:hypothetical protein n=1 Tax=Kovacikia minuta TaxID=2931930 RepID=UPI001CD030DA|nr:hypothetical protein [Kovacikia minuta]UBF23700.1 hypothetical protein K9N68_18175 [Kovacikia minuta CCNUW1]